MNAKASYRTYFNSVKRVVKITHILNDIGVSHSNYSKFCKSPRYDELISIEKLIEIENAIKTELLKHV